MDGRLEGLGIGRGCGAGSWWRMLAEPLVLVEQGLRLPAPFGLLLVGDELAEVKRERGALG